MSFSLITNYSKLYCKSESHCSPVISCNLVIGINRIRFNPLSGIILLVMYVKNIDTPIGYLLRSPILACCNNVVVGHFYNEAKHFFSLD